MFDEDPSKRATILGAIILIATIAIFLAAMFLFATKWGEWTSR
jgi:hypothetical protein